jgi:putative ABC transport system permease protein
MPDAFTFPPPIAFEGAPAPVTNDVWTPLGVDLAGGQRGAHYLLALARLRPGIDAAAAERELSGIAAQIAREHPASNADWTVRVVSFAQQVTGDQRPALLALSIAVGLVLLLACANVASLLLARGVGRRREMAVRAALGATRSRIVRQLLTETLLLSFAGGAAGLLLASWFVRSVRGLGGPLLPRLNEVALDPRALVFTAAACVAAALIFGIVPALQLSHGRMPEWLKERRGAPRTGIMQPALVVTELALSLVLLAGAALLGESFVRLTATDPGFHTDRTLTAHFTLPEMRYPNREARAAFVERMLERLRVAPGIVAAGTIDALPLADDRQGTGFSIEGEPPSEAVANAGVNFSFVSPGYFEALGIPLLRGRLFDTRDRADSAPTIIINQAMARRFFNERNPVGRRITVGFNTRAPREIVGVVGDERHVALDREPPPGVYVSYLQFGWSSRLTVAARTDGEPALAADQLREIVRGIDPQLALYDVRTMEQVVSDSVSRPRFAALLLANFASVALLLAGIGVYGVISQLVGHRTQEFGVRMALGAAPADVAQLVIRFGIKLAAFGTLVGVPAAFAFSRVLQGLLYGVTASNPLTYASVAVVLVATAVFAAIIPAHRATRLDPLIALRAE